MAISNTDAIIVVVYLVAVMVIGMWMGRGQNSLSDYLLGGRDLPWWAILGSIVATETSTATFLSVPGIAFAKDGDMRFLQITFGFLLGRTLIAGFLMPLFFKGELFTAYDVLHKRFGRATRFVSATIFLVTRNLGDGLRLFLTALALAQVLQLSITVCVVIVGIVTIVYTYFGGIRSVVFNDCFQLVVYLIGGLAAGWIIIDRLPEGWSQLQAFGYETERFRVFDFTSSFTSGKSFWAGLIGGAFLTLGTHGTDQMFVQRYLCARSQAGAAVAVIASALVVMFQFALFLLIGVGLACFFNAFPPNSREFTNDQAFVYFIVNEMPIGLTGVTLAAVFAAAMSTLSSSLNSSASSAVNDFVLQIAPKQSKKSVSLSQALTVVFCVVQVAIAIVAQYFSRSVVNEALGIAGFAAGLLLGVFLLATLVRKAGQVSAVVGIVTASIVLLYVKQATSIHHFWYSVIGSMVVLAVGAALTPLFPAANNDQAPSKQA